MIIPNIIINISATRLERRRRAVATRTEQRGHWRLAAVRAPYASTAADWPSPHHNKRQHAVARATRGHVSCAAAGSARVTPSSPSTRRCGVATTVSPPPKSSVPLCACPSIRSRPTVSVVSVCVRARTPLIDKTHRLPCCTSALLHADRLSQFTVRERRYHASRCRSKYAKFRYHPRPR